MQGTRSEIAGVINTNKKGNFHKKKKKESTHERVLYPKEDKPFMEKASSQLDLK